MESTELVVRLIILFVPGILETFVYEMCQNKEDINDRGFIVNVVLSAFVTYSFTGLFFKLTGGEATFLDVLIDSSVRINMLEVLMASVLAIVLGVLEANVIRKAFKLTRKDMKETEKYAFQYGMICLMKKMAMMDISKLY